jgi:hypothetical protein
VVDIEPEGREPERYKLLPPSMGFEQEEWFYATDGHGPHYTCVANGVRICVWTDINADGGDWHLQLARPEYHTSNSWTSKTFGEMVDIPIGDALVLMAAIHDLTSGGNNEE